MRTNQAVKQWASTVQADAALAELKALKDKYPWMKCERALKALETVNEGIPKIVQIIIHQDKQLAIHNEVIRVSKIADEAIIRGIADKFGIEI